MFKKIVLFSSFIVCCGLIATVDERYVSRQMYIDELKKSLIRFNIEKVTLVESFAFSPEKTFLFCLPWVLNKFSKRISSWGNLNIEDTISIISCGLSFLFTFHLLNRFIRLIYVFSDIKAIEKELAQSITGNGARN